MIFDKEYPIIAKCICEILRLCFIHLFVLNKKEKKHGNNCFKYFRTAKSPYVDVITCIYIYIFFF